MSRQNWNDLTFLLLFALWHIIIEFKRSKESLFTFYIKKRTCQKLKRSYWAFLKWKYSKILMRIYQKFPIDPHTQVWSRNHWKLHTIFRYSDFPPIFGHIFGSKFAEMKILLCKWHMAIKTYFIISFKLFFKNLTSQSKCLQKRRFCEFISLDMNKTFPFYHFQMP